MPTALFWAEELAAIDEKRGKIKATLPAEQPELDDSKLLDQLLPDRWLLANPQHRWNIDEIRRQERKKRHQKLRQRRKK